MFNCNATSFFADYGFSAPDGVWKVILDSDDAAFGGFSRVNGKVDHFSIAGASPNGNGKYDHHLMLYLPSRTAMVLKKKQ